VARQIAQALQVRDEPRARELIEDGEFMFGHNAPVAEVERQAGEAELATLKAGQDMMPSARSTRAEKGVVERFTIRRPSMLPSNNWPRVL
jgi:hypothetical protein